jgi:tripartite-type tricarboxylate transporter receptor subunit TctC
MLFQGARLPRRAFLHSTAGAAAFLAVSRVACAQTYPNRPVTIVVGFAAGGPTDVTARSMAERMQVSLGQPVIVENVAGAAGSIGAGRVARAAPDGYTLSLGAWNTHVANGALYKLPYDVLRDFEPISLISRFPILIVAKKSMPANNLSGLITWLKANPDKASWGTGGVGSAGHLVGIFFQNITGTRFQHVPYRGFAPAMQDVVAGEVDLMFADPITGLPQLRAGSIKAYAVTARRRLAQSPDIPTVDEAGLPKFYFSQWYALFAPGGTPDNIIAKLHDSVVSALGDPALRRKLPDLGMEIASSNDQTPQALRSLQKAEIEKWWPIIKAANIAGE